MGKDQEIYIDDDEEDYTPRTFHLRYGEILTNYEKNRFIIAVQEETDDPMVIVRFVAEDGFPYYELHEYALTKKQAAEILDELEKNNKRKANTLLKRYFDGSAPKVEGVGEVRLDDAIDDDWYNSWKEMKGIITFTRNYPGYYEAEVKEPEL